MGSLYGKFDLPNGLAIHPEYNGVFICDLNNHRLKIFTATFHCQTSIEKLLFTKDIKFISAMVVRWDESDFGIHLYDLKLWNKGIFVSRKHDIGLAYYFTVDTEE